MSSTTPTSISGTANKASQARDAVQGVRSVLDSISGADPLSPLMETSSPLGEDFLPNQSGSLHAIALNAHESISQPFHVSLTIVTTAGQLSPDLLLYNPFCVTIKRSPSADRHFNGVVQRMTPVGKTERGRWTYQLEIVPRLWFLSQSEDCRIFQNQSVDQILTTLLSEHGVQPFEFKIYGDKPVREYTTQFNETTLGFMHRLLQEEGWFYFFEHSKSEHKLIITDRNESFLPVSRPLHRVVPKGNNVDIIDQWGGGSATAHGQVTLTDYAPSRPAVPIHAQEVTLSTTAGAATRKVARWPALTKDQKTADRRARSHIEHAEASSSICRGHGYDPEFMPGRRFQIESDPLTGNEMTEYALQSVSHLASDNTWAGQSSGAHYDCSFSCFLQATPWREPANNARPAMTGIFSGVVIGPKGQQIHADSLGRIKVRIIFDHRKETSSGFATWVRVIQPWAGDSWGWQHLPRVGTEVAVAFMNGDPDEPVVIGGLYNQSMQPVFAVPSEQTKSGFRSRSVHGSSSEFSELSIDDNKGQEKIYLRSQRDLQTYVLNDRKTDIDGYSTTNIEKDVSLTTKKGSMTVTSETGAVTIQAETEITLKVGASTLRLTQDGITLNSDKITGTAGNTITFLGSTIHLNG
ncbi:type VI secretion system Vgr family protein [Acetobacter thailandicus]|uniref:type VI secretion system Vgr family protein n=1 Tax=Acetobacter thailandicus TaxID=1502842 RepID=UPI001BA6660B|nr:type VI secretion system tip protein TssI/VgrG [Acetobacter thailandicus]MBS1003269.1 type VI secretion system tip protein VgrG [Acetobacter thailandicus]